MRLMSKRIGPQPDVGAKLPEIAVPEVSVGTGSNQIRLTGSEAIRAAGPSLRLLIGARAFSMAATAIAALLAAWLAFSKLPWLAELAGRLF
jgi:hypothetical protein